MPRVPVRMSRQGEHRRMGDHVARGAAGSGHEGSSSGELRRLVERCGRDVERLRQLLRQLRGPLRSALIREAQRLHGAGVVQALLAAPAGAPDRAEQEATRDPRAEARRPRRPDRPATPDSGARGSAPAPEHGPPEASAAPAPGAEGQDVDTQGVDDPHRGDRGPQVVELQQLLKSAGYYHANVGGNFGPQTEAAVRQFQREHGLEDDGRATAATMEALRGAVPADAQVDPAAPTDAGAEPGAPAAGADSALSYGMSVLGAPYAAINPYRFGDVPWPGGAKVDIHGKMRGPFPAGTQVFDCSGFVVACWRRAGVDLISHNLGSSRDVVANKSWLIPVAPEQLQPGDLIAYPGHIVMYIGNDKVIQSTPSGGVKISDASGYLGESGAVCRRVPV
jgi:peptidoglycan DL-endopeptidase CwlO